MVTGNNNSEILTIKEPTLVRSPIIIEHHGKNSTMSSDATKTEGAEEPFIRINTYKININDIVKFKLSSSGFIPTLDIVFYDRDKIFSGDFVKDGDYVELYIRSKNDKKFKKIRTDFDIIKVVSNPTDDGIVYSLSCVQKIPMIFRERQISLLNDSSFNHLMQICDLTGLGFASNEVSTEDRMTRLCPSDTLGNFIKKTTETSYKNDDSFFTSYIDIYDYLCFVNVNNTFSLDDELEDAYLDVISELSKDKNATDDGVKSKLVFTNLPKYEGTSSFITKYSLFNNSGNIWMNNGYMTNVQYMDMDDLQFRAFKMDTLTTRGAENDYIILKGKSGDNSYLNHIRDNVNPRLYSTLREGNLHPNYHYAKSLNNRNNLEIEKMGMTVQLDGFSSNIYRYKRIPVAIYTTGDIVTATINTTRNEQNGDNMNNGANNYDNNWILNTFMSGWYVVKDYYISWDNDSGFSQVVNLLRREWNTPISAGALKKINN